MCSWMSADGNLNIIKDAMGCESRWAICQRGDVNVSIYSPWKRGDVIFPAKIYISWGRTDSQINLSISKRESVTIEMWGRGDEDLQGVALLQVLLSGGQGPTFRCDGHPVKVHLIWWVVKVDKKLGRCRRVWAEVSEAGVVKTQIAPLMPLAPKISFPDESVVVSLF